MRFLIDMNLSPLWSNFLAEQGFEATHWSKIGQAGAADIKIFDFAAAGNWIVFMHDLDFGNLLAALRTSKPSVLQVRTQDVLPSAIGDVVLGAIRRAEPTSQQAPSSPWILNATEFDCCRCESGRSHPSIHRSEMRSGKSVFDLLLTLQART